MRATNFAWQLLGAACALSSLLGCAESGVVDTDLEPDAEARQAADKNDAGKVGSRDARVARQDDPSDDESASTTKHDAGTGAARDSSTSAASSRDGGSAAAIKCPSPLICTSDISSILALLDPSVPMDAKLCAQKGSLIPMAVTCSSTDECKNARLTTGTCSGGNCIQPCTP
jgi:hypothetical protein